MGFAAQLTRAAAQRGKLDPVYRDLSDDLTLTCSGCSRSGR